MDWTQILVSALVTLLLSGILIPISTKIVGRHMTRYFDNKDKAQKEAEENAEKVKRQEKKEQEELFIVKVDDIVKKHTDPIDTRLDAMKQDLGKLKSGTLDTLRDRILSTYYKCVDKGFYTQYEFENIHHMYDDYSDLHGNSFVEKVIKQFDEIDSEEKFKANHKKKRAPRKPRQVKEG